MSILLLLSKAVVTVVAVAIPWLVAVNVEERPHGLGAVHGALPGDAPVAVPVPGKPGFCFSPFTNKIVDVQGIPAGTLVQDPTVPAGEGLFRVP